MTKSLKKACGKKRKMYKQYINNQTEANEKGISVIQQVDYKLGVC